jgi:hypothetical protein
MGEVGLPLVPILLVVLLGKALVSDSMSPPAAVCALSALLVCAIGAAALVSPSIKLWLFDRVTRALAA